MFVTLSKTPLKFSINYYFFPIQFLKFPNYAFYTKNYKKKDIYNNSSENMAKKYYFSINKIGHIH